MRVFNDRDSLGVGSVLCAVSDGAEQLNTLHLLLNHPFLFVPLMSAFMQPQPHTPYCLLL